MSSDLVRFKMGENVLLTGRVVWRRANGMIGLQIANGALVTVDEAALTAATEGIPQPDVLPVMTRDVPGPKDERRRGPGRPPKQQPTNP